MNNKILLIIVAVTLLAFPKVNFGQAPNLGTTSSFALFTADGAFTVVGASNVTGNVGTNVGAFNGFPPGTLTGQKHNTDPVSVVAAIDVATAYSDLSAVTCGTVIGTTLGNNQLLVPGVYCALAASTLNGDLILDGQGNPNALFIIKIDGALATSTHTNVLLINSTIPSNVYWQINGAFTLGDSSVFRGTIIAYNAINLLEGAALYGRGLSVTGAISLHNNIVSVALPPIASIITANGPTTFCTGGSVILSGNVDGTWNTGATTPSITVTTAGDYYVTNTNAFGTVTSNHIIVTVNPNPTAVAGPNRVICQNVSTQIGAAAVIGHTYSWSSTPAGFTSTLSNPIVTPLLTTTYTVVETITATGCINSNSVVVTVNPLPAAVAGVNIAICLNGSVQIGAAPVIGSTYSWTSVPVGFTSTQANPTVSPLVTTTYTVVETVTATGCQNSHSATVTVNQPTTLISGPSNQTVCAGSPASFTVIASGTGLTYQWRKGASNLTNGGNITGATSALLTINPASVSDAAADYNVVISSVCSQPVISPNVALIVNTLPAIGTQPTDQIACTGTTASFNVTATGTGITYQWRKGVLILSNSGNISGVNSATLTINPVNIANAGADYNVVITGTCPPEVTSVNVALVVYTPPTIIQEPVIQTLCAGGSASFYVLTTGTGLTFQWRKGTVPLTDGGNISGANTAMLTINPVSIIDAAADYNVVVSGTCTPAAISTNVPLVVNTPPSIIAEPASITTCIGSSASFYVNATGTSLTYQWRKGSLILTDGGNISGANTATLTINPVSISDLASDYNVVISGTCEPIATSVNVTLDIFPLPTISCPANVTQGTDPNVCNAIVPNINPVITGNCPDFNLSYQLTGMTTGSGTGNASGLTFNKGVTLVTYVVVDAAGLNSSCEFTITINDNQPPILLPPANLVVFTDKDECFASDLILGNAIASDNCLSVVITNNGTPTYPKGVNLVTWTAIDGSGNQTNVTQTITVIDNELPTLICPADITTIVNPGTCFATNVNLGNPVATDNCPGIILSNDAPAAYPSGITPVIWTAVDASGNTSTCTQLVTIIDNVPPMIECPPDLTVNTDFDECTATNVNLGTPLSSDNCSGTSLSNNAPSVFAYGNTIVTWIAVDASGNSTFCTQMITVIDNQPPEISCPADITVNGTTIVVIPPAIFSDNCGIASVTNSFNGTSNASGTYPIGTTFVTWVVTDIHGNTAVCTQLVNVNCQVIALNDYIVLPSNLSGSINLSGNDLICGSALNCDIISIVVPPTHLTVTLSYIPGEVIIVPQAGFVGIDSLLYQICCVLPNGSTLCSTAWAIITILNPPIAHISGNTTICLEGYATLIFTMTGVPPFTLQYTDGVNIYTLPGIMTHTYFISVHPLVTTNYTLVSVTDATSLYGFVSGLATVTVIYIPPFIVTGGGGFCYNSLGAVIGLSGSTPGILYQVLLNGNPFGLPVYGTGQPIDLGIFNIPGFYTVSAYNPITGCTTMMYGAAPVSQFPGPNVYTVTGGGECCFGCLDVFVGLDGSQLGVMYHVWLNDTLLHNIAGTGGVLDFGWITQSGLYTVTATDSNGCIIEMNGNAVVTIHPRPVATLTSADYTICLGDSVILWINTTAGTGPFTFTISTGDSIFSVVDTCLPFPIAVFPTHLTTYTLLTVNDIYCIDYGYGAVTVDVVNCIPNPVYSISGYVRYNNSILSPMNNVNVALDKNNLTVGTVNTDANGYYHFDNLVPGNYKLSSTTLKPFGGINSTDALLIARSFAQIVNLTGINLMAADVNASNYVNSVDALFVARRYVNLITSFPAGDWAFEKPTVNILNNSVTTNILALTYGDVNGSYLPPNVKQPSTVSLSVSGTREIRSFEQFELPISTTGPMMLGAISLVLNYPANLLEVTSVKVEDQDKGNLIYNAENGELRIAWYNINALNLETGETILHIGFKAGNLDNVQNDGIIFNLGSGSEIANREGSALQHVELVTPKLIHATPSFDVNIYPNPTNGSTQFVYLLPEEGKINIKIYDMLGKEVAALINATKDAGSNYLTFNANSLTPGIYICHVIYTSSTQTRTMIKRLEIIK